MNDTIKTLFENAKSKDKQVSYEAYQSILKETEQEVDWAYEVWDQLIADLADKDNHQRSRAAQYLAHLAKSDPENRMLMAFPNLWNVTKDEKFVTARHSLQSIWKVALAGQEQKEIVIQHFAYRFQNCEDEKNYTLIRSDIIQNFRNLYDQLKDEELKVQALSLIDFVEDRKYQKKYLNIWK